MKEDKGKQIIGNEGVHSKEEEDSKFIIVDPHEQKIEKLHNQLEALMYRNDLKVAGPTQWSGNLLLFLKSTSLSN